MQVSHASASRFVHSARLRHKISLTDRLKQGSDTGGACQGQIQLGVSCTHQQLCLLGLDVVRHCCWYEMLSGVGKGLVFRTRSEAPCLNHVPLPSKSPGQVLMIQAVRGCLHFKFERSLKQSHASIRACHSEEVAGNLPALSRDKCKTAGKVNTKSLQHASSATEPSTLSSTARTRTIPGQPLVLGMIRASQLRLELACIHHPHALCAQPSTQIHRVA